MPAECPICHGPCMEVEPADLTESTQDALRRVRNEQKENAEADRRPTFDEQRGAYLAEIDRLRQLVILVAEDMETAVLPALVASCQHATGENLGLRMALLEARCLVGMLNENGASS